MLEADRLAHPDEALSFEGERPGESLNRGRLRTFLADRGAAVGVVVIILLTLMAIFAPWISPYEPNAQHVIEAYRAPSLKYWLGTDEFGRDVLSRIIYGARPALVIGVLSVVVAAGIGTPLGLLAGYRRGRLDTAVSAVVDVMMSFPSLLLALMVVTLVGSTPFTVIMAIGVSHIPIFVRLARSSTLVIRELDYVAASRSFGASTLRIIRQHILPNVIGPTVVIATLSIAGAIREEAALSFLGLGIQPPAPSWGNLIRDGVNGILQAPWLALLPGLFLTAGVLAFNMVGDVVRDMLDPHDVAAAAANRGAVR